MNLKFEVKRNRQSVTQGEASVYLNDTEIVTFSDIIELIDNNSDKQHYGKNIGGWASVKSDKFFVNGVLFPLFGDRQGFGYKIKKTLLAENPNRFEEANGIFFVAYGMTDKIKEYFRGCGVEIQEVATDIFYTETVMSVSEFSEFFHIDKYWHVA